MSYWEECISEAMDEAGIIATEEQVKSIAEAAEGAHENYSMAFGHDSGPNPLIQENKKLKEKLKDEYRKVRCERCKGLGSTAGFGGADECFKCNGSGLVFTNK